METLFNLPDQTKPVYLADLCRQDLESEDLPLRILRLRQIGAILARAWADHPLYGHTGYPENPSNPYIRLEVHHVPGPRTGNPVSVSFVRLREASGEMRDIARKLHQVADWSFQIMPVKPTDPVMGTDAANPKIYGDYYLRIPRYWDFPNRSGLNFVARKRFKERFPNLRPILAEALLIKKRRARISPDFARRLAAAGIGRLGSRKQQFQQQVASRPEWLSLLCAAGVSSNEIWAVANNELAPEDIDHLGRQSDLFR